MLGSTHNHPELHSSREQGMASQAEIAAVVTVLHAARDELGAREEHSRIMENAVQHPEKSDKPCPAQGQSVAREAVAE